MTVRDQIEIVEGAAAPDVVLRDADGVEHALSEYWRAEPTALVFVRHFG